VNSEAPEIIFRTRGGLSVSFDLPAADESSCKKALVQELTDLSEKLQSESLVLSVRHSSLYVWPNTGVSTSPSSLTDDSPCKDILNFIQFDDDDDRRKNSKRKEKRQQKMQQVVNLSIMFELSTSSKAVTPIITYNKQSRHCVSLTLPIDTAVSVSSEEKWRSVCGILVKALKQQLTEMERCMLKYIKGTSICLAEPFHFMLPESKGFLTVVYPAGVAESQLEDHRKVFCVPDGICPTENEERHIKHFQSPGKTRL
ncbi:unnamed protein product, partial [Staurois parvus]